MITPINNQVMIEPLKHDSFLVQDKTTFEEVGIVVAFDDSYENGQKMRIKKGDRIFFDSWLASKYPKNETEYFWLVNYDDIKAIEYV